MNVAVSGIRRPTSRAGAPRHRRLRHPSVDEAKTEITQYLSERWRKHYDSYGGASEASLHRIDGLSAHVAGHRARRRLAAERRAAGLRSRLHAQAASRPQQHRVRHAASRCGSAATTSATWNSPRRSRTAVNDWQIDAWVDPEPRLRGRRSLCRRKIPRPRSRRSSGAPAIRASCRSVARRASASRSATAATGRSSRRPQRRQSADRAAYRRHTGGHPPTGARLAVLLFRAPLSPTTGCMSLVTSMVLEGVFEQIPEAAGAAGRGRLRLGAGAVLAAGQALGAHAGRGAAS